MLSNLIFDDDPTIISLVVERNFGFAVSFRSLRKNCNHSIIRTGKPIKSFVRLVMIHQTNKVVFLEKLA